MLSAEGPEDTTEAWKQDLGDRIEEIIDRKRSSVQGREACLAQYSHYLMSHYAYDEIEHKTGELFPALLKSIKAESSEKETCLALRGQLDLQLDFAGSKLTFWHSYCPHNHHSPFRNRLRCHIPGFKTNIHRIRIS
jgi:hypothetical protein